ncbi:DUF292-domain-containing protein [Aspergillus heteromorphus CBS 117.55]|uniref:DUF292-domain-containing protein n=1 Tax=Aspergillus heteromorphus CBS 117.55 TaxID=1448321 RepID=A0A317UZ27_9EURO|nr:DUF292-domain-containing protein [Aspergillus heteromorphus CBS 117.55]PWY66451.1 DUF292-domain-containing protein [Aspergillus heteromorphus CBS 117.55]
MSDYKLGPYAPVRSLSPITPPHAPFSNPQGLQSVDSLSSRSTLYFLPNDILEDHMDDRAYRHMNKMPPQDIDERLLLAGLETRWDSADRLAVPHLNVQKPSSDDRGPPSPSPSYISHGSSLSFNKPLPPVPGLGDKDSSRPFGRTSGGQSSVRRESPPGYAPQPLALRPTTPRPMTPSPAYDTRVSLPAYITVSSHPLCCDTPTHDAPSHVIPTYNSPAIDPRPSTPRSSAPRPTTPRPTIVIPEGKGATNLRHEYTVPEAQEYSFFEPDRSPDRIPHWLKPLGLRTENLPPLPRNNSPANSMKVPSQTDLGYQKQPAKKTSHQELKQDGDEKPLWRSLKAGVRRVLTRKAASHDGSVKASKSGKSKHKNARRASIIVRMSTIPPMQPPPAESFQFPEEKEDEGRYEDAIKRMKNVLASLLEDGYSMDAILQAEANQQFLRSLFTRVQNEPLLGVDTEPPIVSPPASHASLPSEPPRSYSPLPVGSLFDEPRSFEPPSNDDNEDSWTYVGYDDDEANTVGAPSVRYFSDTTPISPSMPEPRDSVPPFAMVMAELDDDLQRMTSNRWSLSQPGREDMVLHILLQIDDIDDLFSFAQTSKATYHVFKRHELPLMENAIRRGSPAAWELRQMSDINQQSDQDMPSATLYYRAVTRDLRALAALKGLMLTHCRPVMRTSSYTALSRPSSPDARRLDDAIWRIWTFCYLFGMQTGRETDMDGQVSWLRGEIGSPFQPCPDPKDVASIMFDPPPGFGEGNPGGLSVTDMQDMDEIWTCLKYMLGFLRGETERARRFGVFQNAGVAPERNQGMIVLHEGPRRGRAVGSGYASRDDVSARDVPRVDELGGAEAGGDQGAFLTDALGRVSGGLRRLEETKLTSTLHLLIPRLRLLQKKDTASSVIQRRDLSTLLAEGRDNSARIRVENVIATDIAVEVMEMVELYCELLLARANVIDQQLTSPPPEKDPAAESSGYIDPALDEAAAVIFYAYTRFPHDVRELTILRGLLTDRWGKEFMLLAQDNKLVDVRVPERLVKGLRVRPPTTELVESYLAEIARAYGVAAWPRGGDRRWGFGEGNVGSGDVDGDGSGDVPVPVTPTRTRTGSPATATAADETEARRASETLELHKATPPRGLFDAGKSPVSVAPPGPRTDNLHPRVKVSGGDLPRDTDADADADVDKGTGRGGKSEIPELDELTRRFAALRR